MCCAGTDEVHRFLRNTFMGLRIVLCSGSSHLRTTAQHELKRYARENSLQGNNIHEQYDATARCCYAIFIRAVLR